MVLFDTITKVGTRNGVNALDIYLTTGSPLSYPSSPGALTFMSNSKLGPFVGFSKLSSFVQTGYDLVYSSWANNCLTIQPDSTTAAGLSTTSPNRFIATSSLTAQVYYAQSGSIKLCTTDSFRTFTGIIGLNGTSFYNSIKPSVTYQAAISAKFLGTQDFNL